MAGPRAPIGNLKQHITNNAATLERRKPATARVSRQGRDLRAVHDSSDSDSDSGSESDSSNESISDKETASGRARQSESESDSESDSDTGAEVKSSVAPASSKNNVPISQPNKPAPSSQTNGKPVPSSQFYSKPSPSSQLSNNTIIPSSQPPTKPSSASSQLGNTQTTSNTTISSQYANKPTTSSQRSNETAAPRQSNNRMANHVSKMVRHAQRPPVSHSSSSSESSSDSSSGESDSEVELPTNSKPVTSSATKTAPTKPTNGKPITSSAMKTTPARSVAKPQSPIEVESDSSDSDSDAGVPVPKKDAKPNPVSKMPLKREESSSESESDDDSDSESESEQELPQKPQHARPAATPQVAKASQIAKAASRDSSDSESESEDDPEAMALEKRDAMIAMPTKVPEIQSGDFSLCKLDESMTSGQVAQIAENEGKQVWYFAMPQSVQIEVTQEQGILPDKTEAGETVTIKMHIPKGGNEEMDLDHSLVAEYFKRVTRFGEPGNVNKRPGVSPNGHKPVEMTRAPQLLPSLQSVGTPKDQTKKRKEAPSPDLAEPSSGKHVKKARVNGSQPGTQDASSKKPAMQTPIAPPAVPTHVSPPPKVVNGTKIPPKVTPVMPPVVPGMKN